MKLNVKLSGCSSGGIAVDGTRVCVNSGGITVGKTRWANEHRRASSAIFDPKTPGGYHVSRAGPIIWEICWRLNHGLCVTLPRFERRPQ